MIKEAEVDLSEFMDCRSFYHPIGRFIEGVSIRKRIHSSLGDLTPAKLEAQLRTRQAIGALDAIL